MQPVGGRNKELLGKDEKKPAPATVDSNFPEKKCPSKDNATTNGASVVLLTIKRLALVQQMDLETGCSEHMI